MNLSTIGVNGPACMTSLAPQAAYGLSMNKASTGIHGISTFLRHLCESNNKKLIISSVMSLYNITWVPSQVRPLPSIEYRFTLVRPVIKLSLDDCSGKYQHSIQKAYAITTRLTYHVFCFIQMPYYHCVDNLCNIVLTLFFKPTVTLQKHAYLDLRMTRKCQFQLSHS